MTNAESIAETFQDLDFHDDTFVDLRVLPPRIRDDVAHSTVEVHLLKTSNQAVHIIRFCGCRNLRVAIDFDVLANNLPWNTSRVDAHTDLIRMRDLMQSQKRDWAVDYSAASSGHKHRGSVVLSAQSPLDDKLAATERLVCFRVQLFGGAIEVIADNYTVVISEKK